VSEEITLRDVYLRYAGSPVLSGVSLAVARGEILSVLGPSGGGKTSLLRVVLGFLPPTGGTVLLEGEPVSRDGRVMRPPEERGLAVVPQDLALWPHLTVRGHLAFGLEARRVRRREREERIWEMLKRVGLAALAARYPGELSGGEQQRVAIARALVVEPRAVLFDEPLANLDVATKGAIEAVFRDLLKERGMSAIYVTHDFREARELGDRIAVLESGRIVQSGSAFDLIERPATSFVKALVRDVAQGGSWGGEGAR